MVIDFSTYYDLPAQIDRIFEEMRKPLYFTQRRLSYPPVNICEDDRNIYVSSEIPGVEIGDIDLTLTDGSLVIKGERKSESGKYFRQERATGNFQRIITLNVPVNQGKVSATMKNGVLSIVLPKAEEAQPKKIDITVS
ncbi:Hsp20/alpha crystallin family protein [Desulfoplanes formicivorans]|uniref:Molecular chaperone Hsp20 n=1 Tax=Desulfoplanes formicivorans TaxID=1592317 RepID=A0A194ALP5_9BACT|nr:Hsp20/alpha crystallin family protein [Desulfoplanes formicivorans]GAU09951.1 molecular chaperone Hsp20 [Desulfoplanes formicivorans]